MTAEERRELEELAKDGIVAVGLVLEEIAGDLAEGRDPRDRET